jgi:YesN/AraC family two-component response regulator
VFIDQFEELFTLYAHNGTKSKMLNFFENILSNDKISTKIVLSLREDFLAELWEVSEKIPALYDRKNTYRLKRLARENAKQTIVNTIKYVNYSIEDDLTEQLLDDFTQKDEGIYPPYIQIVCHEIFKQHKETYNKSEETPINLAIYKKFCGEELSGVEKIIAEYFEEILDGFSFEERTVIHEILAPMITYFYTKQRITYEQISEINSNRIDIDKTLDRLINHRIINKIETEKNEYELIHDFLAKKILENKPSVGISSKIKKALEYIENNFEKQISLQDISESVGFSREHFSRVFKVEMKENFIDYLNKRRIEETKKYIRKDPRIKVVEIYKQVGFTNQQHFTKIFKKVTGYTPNAYRKKVLE